MHPRDGSGLAYQVTLDNTKSNVAVTRTFTADDIPGSSTPWATAEPTTDTLAEGATETFTLTPNRTVCDTDPQTYTAHPRLTSGGVSYPSITLTDTIERDD